MKIILLFTLLFSVTALECKISNGVEYVNIRGNLQPDGCPDGLQCVNETCSSVSAATGKDFSGAPCAVWAKSTRYIMVHNSDVEDDIAGKPWTYTKDGCGENADYEELVCVGDWGDKYEETCPPCDDLADPPVPCSAKCRTGGKTCNYPGTETGCNAGYFQLGSCQAKGREGWAAGSVILVILLIVFDLALLAWVLWYCGVLKCKKWNCRNNT